MPYTDHTCECSAVYRLHKHKFPARDNDSKQCGFCDRTLIEWNGGVMYSAELLIAPESAK